MKTSKAAAPHYIWGADCDGWRLVDRPDQSIIHERMPAGASEERHYHERAHQFFFVLSGSAVMEIEGELHHLQPQEGIDVASGLRHCIRNESAEPVEFLVISAPTTRGDRIAAPPVTDTSPGRDAR
ncbi:cupin domain-containing protein [Paenibacillus xanthanilyticus]|uniref:Cupin domain-containing protein n=1 Tax=Paenibacillus xanthanilyticus TaxID=1783531 RepID=A0ABV8K2H2_9BACL